MDSLLVTSRIFVEMFSILSKLFNASALMSVAMTRAPLVANCKAVALPIPKKKENRGFFVG